MNCLPWLNCRVWEIQNINYMIVTQYLVCNSILSLHPGRGLGVVSSVKMVSGQNGKFSQNGMSGQKGNCAFRSKCKQLRP